MPTPRAAAALPPVLMPVGPAATGLTLLAPVGPADTGLLSSSTPGRAAPLPPIEASLPRLGLPCAKPAGGVPAPGLGPATAAGF